MKNMKSSIAPVFIALSFGLSGFGCPSWWARTPQHIEDVAAILACVVDKSESGMKPAEVAIACGLENADKVIDLLRMQQAIEAKHIAKLAAATSSSLASPQPSANTSIVPSSSTSASAKPVSSTSTSTSTSISTSVKPVTSASTKSK